MPLGTLFALRTDEIDPELADALKLDNKSQIFMINTEGNTDPVEFRRILWDGKNPVPDCFRVSEVSAEQ